MKLPNKNKIPDHFIFISMTLLLAFLISGCNDDTVGLSVSSTSVKSLEASDSHIVSSVNPMPAVPSESKYMTLASGASTGISVVGESTISVKPDIAILDIGVETFAESVALARQSAAQEMGSVISALKKQGVDDDMVFSVRSDQEISEVIVLVDSIAKVEQNHIDTSSVIISSADGSVEYISGVDYNVDPETGFIRALSSS